jgi:hypothetical protein
MRLTPRLGIRLILVFVVLVLLWFRLLPRLMRRHDARTSATTGDLSVTHPLNRPGGGPAPAIAYDIYSTLYQQPAPTPINEPLVIAAGSQADIPQVGGSCLKPSTPEERELADAFAAANVQSHEWEQKFTIPAGYRLLAPGEAAQVQACLQAHGHGPSVCDRYKDIRHVRFLGVPGLDHAQTHGLVSVIKSCGSDCGSGGIFEVEKSGETWQRTPTTDFTRDCSWAY